MISVKGGNQMLGGRSKERSPFFVEGWKSSLFKKSLTHNYLVSADVHSVTFDFCNNVAYICEPLISNELNCLLWIQVQKQSKQVSFLF